MYKLIKPFLLVLIIAIISSCTNSNKPSEISSDLIHNPVSANGINEDNNLPAIQFNNKLHDFGIIIQGEKVTHLFKFKNNGKTDLIIKDATASCGCTVPSFPRKPIGAGEEGEIEVVFNSSNRSGRQTKSITVWSNSQPNQTKLRIECEIVVPK